MDGEQNHAAVQTSLRGAVRWTLLSLLLFCAVEGTLFRSGWYLQYLAPQSTAGQVELMHYWLNNSRPTATPEVLVLGDSRIAEGFSARHAIAATGRKFNFWNAGAGGTSPRVWYYLLRDVDPTRTRFTAIVLPFDHYSDQDDADSYDERVTDLNYAIGRLRLSDCYGFARSLNTPSLFLHVFAGCLFKGMMLRDDLNDLLNHPAARVEAAGDWQENGVNYLNGYGGKAEDVSGLSVDWANRQIMFPPGLSQIQRTTIERTLLPRAVPQTGALTRYRQLWFGKILDLYAKYEIRFIFIEVPRAPLPRRESAVPPYFLESMQRRHGISIVPARTFRDLERPDFFADGLHLNHAGRPVFSERLGTTVAAILGGH